MMVFCLLRSLTTSKYFRFSASAKASFPSWKRQPNTMFVCKCDYILILSMFTFWHRKHSVNECVFLAKLSFILKRCDFFCAYISPNLYNYTFICVQSNLPNLCVLDPLPILTNDPPHYTLYCLVVDWFSLWPSWGLYHLPVKNISLINRNVMIRGLFDMSCLLQKSKGFNGF